MFMCLYKPLTDFMASSFREFKKKVYAHEFLQSMHEMLWHSQLNSTLRLECKLQAKKQFYSFEPL